MSCLPVGDYGVIGELHTAALVGRNGSIDWLCAPRFDSPSVFAALLDQVRGGRWCIAPTVPATTEHRYLPGTNPLVTTFRIESGGVLVVTDFMPSGPAREGRTEIHRRVQCTRGACEAEVVFEPRFDYGTRQPVLARRACGVLATDAEDDVATLSCAPDVSWQIEQARATARLSLATDEAAWFVLRCDDDEVYAVAHYRSQDKLDATARWWDEWSSRLQYQGPYRQEVERSALALKLCCYEPSGAIIAAPTTSLPETPGGGGGRNWRSEEHMSELQSPYDLVCRLLLEKKKKKKKRSKTDKMIINQIEIESSVIASGHGCWMSCRDVYRLRVQMMMSESLGVANIVMR